MDAFIRMYDKKVILQCKGKILDFICTRLRSTEIALDSLSLVQYDFCRTKTRANKIPYFTKHCRITYYYWDKRSISEYNHIINIFTSNFISINLLKVKVTYIYLLILNIQMNREIIRYMYFKYQMTQSTTKISNGS